MHLNEKETYDRCVKGLQDFMHTAQLTEIVIGLSGGIDSSLVALMCVDAVGPEQVHGVLLPGPYTSAASIEDAHILADNLGIQTATISINEAYEAFSDALKDVCGGTFDGIAAENTQARCRMIYLMALSNCYGWMLVNTGNKSESAMGYSTLYGDMAGAFAPLGDLYKTEVYALAHWANENARQAQTPQPIPDTVLVKPPSAELAKDQKDETSLGIDYATLDRILMGEVAGIDPDLVNRIQTRVKQYSFKRIFEPPCPKAHHI